MNEPQSYSAKDIERYHRGEMTAAEMHLLEKTALDDPMLADALEGYAGTANVSTDLQALQNCLQKRIEESSKTKVLAFGSGWLKIAALFVLFAGGGWLVFQTLSNKGPDLAKSTAADSSRTNETALTIDKNALSEKTDSTSSTAMNLPRSDADRLRKIEDVAVAETKEPVYKTKKPAASVVLQEREKDLALNKAPEMARTTPGLVKTESRNANADSNNLALGNQAVNMRIRTLDDSTKHVDVVLRPLPSQVDEVVVSKGAAKSKSRGAPVVVDSLEPEQGWTYFDDYVAGNLKAPDEIKTKTSYSKEVELSFDVDTQGNPVNVKVTKSLCEKCDAEAIRLLKEGPKWKGKKKKGKVTIKFPLSP